MKRSTVFKLLGAGLTAVASAIVGYKICHREAYSLLNVGKCEKCIRFIRMHAAWSLTKHLIDDHGCKHEDAYDVVDRVYKRIKERS